MLCKITATRKPHKCDQCHEPIDTGSPAWLDTVFYAVDVDENDLAERFDLPPVADAKPKPKRIVGSTRHWLHRNCAVPRVWRDKAGRVHRKEELCPTL